MARGDYAGGCAPTSTDEVGELARAFNRMAADLATVDRERRDLVATVSHELRTPLAALTALLENLADGVVPADVAAPRRRARARPQRLGGLVEDLLELSRARGRRGRRWTVRTWRCRAGRRTSSPRCAPPAGTVDVDVDVADDLVVAGDPARLRQLLANVLDNAARHAPAEASRPRHRRGRRAAAGTTRGGSRSSTPAREWRRRTATASSSGSAPHGAGGGTGLGLADRPLGGPAPRRHPPLRRPGGRARAPGSGSTVPVSAPPPSSRRRHRSRPQSPPADRSAVPPTVAVAPAPRAAVRAGRRLRPLLARRAARARAPAVVAAAGGSGSLAGIALPFTATSASAWSLVAARRAARLVLAHARRRRREPFTLACARAGRAARAADDAAARRRVDRGAVPPGRQRPCACAASPAAARCPAFVLAGARVAARRRCAACRGSAASLGRRLTGRARAAVRAHHGVVAAGPAASSGAVRLRRRRLRRAGSTAASPTSTVDDLVLRAFLAVRRRRRALGRGVPRAQPAARRARWAAPPGRARPPLRVAGPGAARRRGVRGLPRRAGGGALRRPRLRRSARPGSPTPSTSTRASASSPSPRCSPCSSSGPPPARRRATTAADRLWLRGSLGLLCVLTLVVVGLRAVPDAPLPGGLRLHPAPAAGRRLRGLARPRRARRGASPASSRLRRLAARASRSSPAPSRCSGSPRSTPTPGSPSTTSTATPTTGRLDCATCRTSPPTPTPVFADRAAGGLPLRAAALPDATCAPRHSTTGWPGTSAEPRRGAAHRPRPAPGRRPGGVRRRTGVPADERSDVWAAFGGTSRPGHEPTISAPGPGPSGS